MRWLTDLPASVVVATHTRYLEPGLARTDPPGADLLEFLDTRIEIPRVASAEMLALILARRVDRNVEGTAHAAATLPDVVSEQAIDALFDSYGQGASLRKTLQTVHIALAEAVSAGGAIIQASHIIAAQQA